MLEAEAAQRSSSWTPARRAWVVIYAAFALFCVLGGTGLWALMRRLNMPQTPVFTVLTAPTAAVSIQRAGYIVREQLGEAGKLNVGDLLVVAVNGPPGIAAVLELYPGRLAVWGGSELRAEQRGRGTLPNRVTLTTGQVVVDLPANAPPLAIMIAPTRTLQLAAPGRYLVRHLAGVGDTPDVEVAVAAGRALLGTNEARPGERIVWDTQARLFSLQEGWPLLRDGDFRAFDEASYNATQSVNPPIPAADSWQVRLQNQVDGAAMYGQFRLEQDCSLVNRLRRCRTAGRFVRGGGTQQSSITAIEQSINADVVAYQSVRLSADLRIKAQSLSKGGFLGTECPLLLRVFYTNNIRSNLEANYCFWAIEYPQQPGVESSLPYIKTQRIARNTWERVDVDLKREIPNLLSVERLEIHANGHDYESNVADVRLDGIGVIDQPLEPSVVLPPNGASRGP